MKLGIILHNYGNLSTQAAGFNIGDPIQSIMLERLYNEMGVNENEIKRLNLCDLSTYNGEYILLPMLSVAIGVGFTPLPLSPKIIPLFISAHFVISELNYEQITYLRNYAPIGCRDEYSLNTMRRYNIPAYLTGCITVLFPKRAASINAKDIYIIDEPKALKKFLPEHIRKNAIYETHLLPLDGTSMTEKEAERLYRLSKERLEIYKKRAGLVISSRMHALVPCMAMGIPVIAVFDNLSYRFSWLDKYIPLYTETDFQYINWNPEPVAYEDRKKIIKNILINAIKESKSKYESICELSDFYENRQRALYGNKYHCAIKKAHLVSDKFNYIIWGCGLIGNSAYQIMQDLYPHAKLIVAVDEYVEGQWHGVDIIKSEQLVNYPECFIILATYSGKKQGLAAMKKLGKEEFQDFIDLGTING